MTNPTDETKRCPSCEKPNQFGELCNSCIHEDLSNLADGIWQGVMAQAEQDAYLPPEPEDRY